MYSSTFGQTFRRDAKKGINHAKFVKTPSTRLNVGVIASLMVSSRIDCTLECLSNKECYSINHETSLDGKRSCELLNTDKFRNVDKVVFNANFDHYNIKVSIKLSFANGRSNLSVTQLQYYAQPHCFAFPTLKSTKLHENSNIK